MFDRVHGLEWPAPSASSAPAPKSSIWRGAAPKRSARSSIRCARCCRSWPAPTPRCRPMRANCNQYLDRPHRQHAVDPRLVDRRHRRPHHMLDRVRRRSGSNVSDRPHFQNALHSRDFALSDYLVNRSTSVPSLIATFPVISDGRQPSTASCLRVDQPAMDRRARVARPAQRPGASVLLLDGSGTLVAGSADLAEPHRQAVRRAEPGARTCSRATKARRRPQGFDGVRRIFGYVRVPWTHARLAVGLDEARRAQPASTAKSTVAYLQLGAVRHLVLLVAWFGGEQLIVRADPRRWRAPRRASAAAIFTCARHAGAAGSPSSSRLPPRSTTWRTSSPRARRNCASPTSTSRSWRASTA